MDRHKGYINTYMRERGFGFIESSDYPGRQLWFHYTFFEGGEDSDIYSILHADEPDSDWKAIVVSFHVRTDYRGLQAVNIRIHNSDMDLYPELSEFVRSPKTTSARDEEKFYRVSSLIALSYIDKSPEKRDMVISRITRSPEIWEKVTNLANLWQQVFELFDRSLSWSSEDETLVSQFLSLVAKACRLQTLPKFDLISKRPTALVQPLVGLSTSPLKFFRESRDFFIVLLPDEASLKNILNRDSSIVRYTRDSIKIVLILDDKEFKITSDEYISKNIALLRQRHIIQNLISYYNKEDAVVIGRTLRDIFPNSWMKPIEVGSQYDQAVFVGRSDEKESILDSYDINHAIYGGRKIGKTWFLKDICNSCKADPYDKIYEPFYVSIQSAENPEDAAELILEVIKYQGFKSAKKTGNVINQLTTTILNVHHTTGKIVLLAIDEIDDILQKDTKNKLFGRLRQLQHTYPRSVKFVFAGFKWLIHAMYEESSNHPFANWIGNNHFSLGCLKQDELERLIVPALKWTGLEFHLKELMDEFYKVTSGHPYYAQSLCQNVIQARLQTNAHIISPKNLEKLTTPQFFEEVAEIFIKNLSPLQMLIGKIFANSTDPFSENDILDSLSSRFGITFMLKNIREEMLILQACSVFYRSPNGYLPIMQRINQEFFRDQDDITLALEYLEADHGN